MVAFIDAQRAVHGVEPICAQLPIAPAVYYEHKARQKDPQRLPPRAQRDRVLCGEIRRVYESNRWGETVVISSWRWARPFDNTWSTSAFPKTSYRGSDGPAKTREQQEFVNQC